MVFQFLRKQAANMLTLLNMAFGLTSIMLALEGYYTLSCLAIFCAVLADFADGWVARKLNTVSMLGKFLDSNSDLISFGLAPGLLIYLAIFQHYSRIAGIIAVFAYILCGAFRLARYNAVTFNGYYTGLPIPVAGRIIALSVLAISPSNTIIFIILALVLAFFMASTIPVKKF